MNKRTEQYIWITFGRENMESDFAIEKQNGAVLTGLGYKRDPITEELNSNNFFSIGGAEEFWGDTFPLELQSYTDVTIEVKNGRVTGKIDGQERFSYILSEKYSGGYVGIGTGYTGTELKNIELVYDGKTSAPECCYHFDELFSKRGYEFGISSFYSLNEKVVKRIYNGNGVWIKNVPFIFFKDICKDFTLHFEYRFSRCDFKNREKEKIKEFRDPYGSFAFGPAPHQYFVDWRQMSKLCFTKRHSKFIELGISLPIGDISLYVSMPSVGGIRISSEKPKNAIEFPVCNTAIFEPEYTLNLTDSNELYGSDGTCVKIRDYEECWSLDFYNADGEYIHSFNPRNVLFGLDRGLKRQYRIELPLDKDEVIFGTGERFSSFDQHGKRIYFWNTDPCYHGRPVSNDFELWRGYKNVPLIHSGKGYSVFFNTTCCGRADFGYSDSEVMQFEFDDSRLDFYFWAGNSVDNLIKYTDLTGKQLLPPKWAFEYMAGGSNGFWYPNGKRLPEIYIPKLRDLLEGHKKMGTMPSAVYCEGQSGQAKENFETAREFGVRVLKWNCGDLPFTFARENYPDSDFHDLPFVQNLYNPSGDVFYFFDFTHPDAQKVMSDMNSEWIEQGLCGGMVDFAELVPSDSKFYNGLNGDRMHNFFAYWYAKGYHDLYKAKLGDDFLCYIRGGCAGSQKWLCTWCGDQHASFDGLKEQLACGLSSSASGFSIWGGDMAGLVGKPEKEVLIRGMQFSTFQPLMRVGGDYSKLPWEYGDDVVEIFKIHFWLRKNLVDTIYSFAIRSHKTGIPMTKTLVMEYPCCYNDCGNGEQYLFCDNILFAPILDNGIREKEMIFPEGKWYGIFSENIIEGGQKIAVPAPIGYSPSYIREGTVMPINLDAQMQMFKPFDDASSISALLITPPEKTRIHTIYFDEKNYSVFSIKPTDNYSFTIQTDNISDYSYAVIFGEAKGISVNGYILTKYNDISYIAENIGFTVKNGKTYMHFNKDNQDSVEITVNGLEGEKM